ncbi:hypothetical protein SAMN05443377_1405 [Propionibacterium cyclohexanicum]|uniref:Uncharacterized protein n=1 Tax=Propionibacterium cyclohexanicum TaxID=64702 RepID=A0A1H9U515_9ACTN|nr:hypothetical protein SAMN05443377_1405 [Propionibacterium cyclohexanicum]
MKPGDFKGLRCDQMSSRLLNDITLALSLTRRRNR